MEINKDNCLLKKAKLENYDDYYKIRSEQKNLFWTGYMNAPIYKDFKLWFQNRIIDPNRQIYLLFCDDKCVGSLHFDHYKDYIAIGYSIKEESEGKGFATLIVKKAVEFGINEKKQNKNITSIRAWINFQNIASIKVIERNGFFRSKNDQVKKRFGKEELYYEYYLNL